MDRQIMQNYNVLGYLQNKALLNTMHMLRILKLRKKSRRRISRDLPALRLISIQDRNILVAILKHGFTTMIEF
jgi:hypothetical protein